MNIFNDLNSIQLIILCICALLIGLAKTGMNDVNLPAVIMLAFFFNGKTSAGIVLPMLIIADVLGILYYVRNTNWKYIIILMPYALIGITIAIIIGKNIPDNIFNILMSIIIILSLILMIFRINKGDNELPSHWLFSLALGLLGGFATMIGNTAGPLMAIYLLSMKLPKNSYIATGGVFFGIVNLVKLPFHIFYWHTVTYKSFMLDAAMIPLIALGAILGIFIVKKIKEKNYRNVVILLTAFSTICLIIKSLL